VKAKRLYSVACACLMAAFVVGACGQPTVSGPSKPQPARQKAQAPDAGDAGADGAVLPEPDFQEQEFGESDRSRDPFRSYEEFFVAEAKDKVKSQRPVVLEDYSLDELNLIGIVQRSNPAMAMLVDPTGKGHTVKRGQFVGRSEVVQGPGRRGASYELNWRVERIRDGDIVFVREDPANPDVPSATKVIPLRPEGALTLEP
jgi:type IV pilus assembly protein PilP